MSFPSVFNVLGHIVGVDYSEGPPVPISNTEVKLTGADNTWLETAREDKLTPTQRQRQAKSLPLFFVFWEVRKDGNKGSSSAFWIPDFWKRERDGERIDVVKR